MFLRVTDFQVFWNLWDFMGFLWKEYGNLWENMGYPRFLSQKIPSKVFGDEKNR